VAIEEVGAGKEGNTKDDQGKARGRRINK